MPRFAAMLAASLLANSAVAQVAPPTGSHQLAYTHTSRSQVAFLDLGSLERTGEVVEGWSFFVLAQPVTAFGLVPADIYWTRIRIDCAAGMARFTYAIALVDGVVAFSEAVEMAETPTQGSWALDAAYACRGETPVRPVVENVDAAILEARMIMGSDAWGPLPNGSDR